MRGVSNCDGRHCVGHGSGEESQRSCERRDRDYNIGLRVGLLFVIFVTSGIGVFAPIFAASFISVNHIAFTILRQFGTGVIISTAFVHVSALLLLTGPWALIIYSGRWRDS